MVSWKDQEGRLLDKIAYKPEFITKRQKLRVGSSRLSIDRSSWWLSFRGCPEYQ